MRCRLGKGKSNLQKRRGAPAVRQAPLSGPRAKAYALRDAGRYTEAFEALRPLYESTPQDSLLALDFGHICMEVEQFDMATRVFAKILEMEPKNLVALSNLGGSLIRVGRLQDARAILEYVLELDPKNLHARINLGGVLQAAGEREANLHNALEAIAIEPTATLAFNNLGAAFSDMAMFSEAKHAYETAVMLDPNNLDALINLAASESRLGNAATSAEMYELVLTKLPIEAKHRADAIRFYAAFEYLKQGVLEKGWDYYEGGFSPLVPAAGARAPRREFRAPRWNGEHLQGKTLMVWREQGLGDELLFASCLHELEAVGGEIIIECDNRLVETFTRSFPLFSVRPESHRALLEDFDFQIPIGSLMRLFRRRKEAFEKVNGYVRSDPQKIEKFRARLAPHAGTDRLVGICWRSGKLDPVRNLGYTSLEEWSELLLSPGLKFVNLQYGHCEDELAAVEQNLGIQIVRWSDIDLKNDLDEVFALINCLDLVVSVQTAVLNMAAFSNVPTLAVKLGGWTKMGSEHVLWSRMVRSFDLNNNPLQALVEILEGAKPVDEPLGTNFDSNERQVRVSELDALGLNLSLRSFLRRLRFETITGFTGDLGEFVLPRRDVVEQRVLEGNLTFGFFNFDPAFWSPIAMLAKLSSEVQKVNTSKDMSAGGWLLIRQLCRLGFFDEVSNTIYSSDFFEGGGCRLARLAWEFSCMGHPVDAINLYSKLLPETLTHSWVIGDIVVTLGRLGEFDQAEQLIKERSGRLNSSELSEIYARLGWVLADQNSAPMARRYFQLGRESGCLSVEWQRNEIKLDLLEHGAEYARAKMDSLYQKHVATKDGFSLLAWTQLSVAAPHFSPNERISDLAIVESLFEEDISTGSITPEWRKNHAIFKAALGDYCGAVEECRDAYLRSQGPFDGFGYIALEAEQSGNFAFVSDLLLVDLLLNRQSAAKFLDFLTLEGVQTGRAGNLRLQFGKADPFKNFQNLLGKGETHDPT